MRNLTPFFAIALAFLTVIIAPNYTVAGDIVAGLSAGTEGGFGVNLHGTFKNFTQDIPLSARFSVGYHKTSAGDPFAARRVFINNNTNGTPEDSANYMQARFDLVFPVIKAGPQQLYFFGGPRWARYTAEFVYVGGNEDFEVRTTPWGYGFGLESYFAINASTDFVIQVGFDHFQNSDLDGHDTTYTPDNTNINPREDYDFSSADEAIDQPQDEILVMVGLQFRL